MYSMPISYDLPDQPQRRRDVQGSLYRLARNLQVPCDIVKIHRLQNVGNRPGKGRLGGRTREYKSLRYGAFLLAVASFEAYFDDLVNYRRTRGRSIGINADRVGQVLQEQYGYNPVPDWRARTRVPGRSKHGNVSPWVYLKDKRLRNYLSDMQSLRNLLAHGGDPRFASNDAETLYPLSAGGVSLRLMSVEGFLQAAEDIASETAISISKANAWSIDVPIWPAPPPTGTGNLTVLAVPYDTFG